MVINRKNIQYFDIIHTLQEAWLSTDVATCGVEVNIWGCTGWTLIDDVW